MKAREIRARLRGKADPELLLCLCGIAESASAQQQEIQMLAEMLDKLTDILLQLGTTIEMTQGAVDKIRKIRGNGSE